MVMKKCNETDFEIIDSFLDRLNIREPIFELIIFILNFKTFVLINLI